MDAQMKSFIEQMPKAELHLHLEGSLEPGLKLKLAEQNDIPLPYRNEAELGEAY